MSIQNKFTTSDIINGDALQILYDFPDATFDACITDPPYGGSYGDFNGEKVTSRLWQKNIKTVFSETKRITKQGAPICVFSDWRRYSDFSDILQEVGFIWRGVAVWHKSWSRPQKGRFMQDTEFIIWGSNGKMPFTRNAPCLHGFFSAGNVPSKKVFHQTQKPMELMREIIKIAEPNSLIIDPFAGSGSTIVAAKEAGHTAIGIEIDKRYAELAKERVQGTIAPV